VAKGSNAPDLGRTFLPAGGDDELSIEVQQELTVVEEMLLEAATSTETLLSDAARHLVRAGGKRFRPMLVLLSARFGNPEAPGIVPAAAVVELIHLATLYHDDVMDEAVMRRGQLSANSRWNNTVAILTGDYLFARASDMMADLGPEAVRLQARTFARLVRGQIAETTGPGEGEEQFHHYLRVVADKTASLIATAGHFGAMLSGAPPTVVETITSACEKIGVAFQLSDDILDIASESAQSGKTPGTDLREGIATLPVLHVLGSTDADDEPLQKLLRGDLTDDDRLAEALRLLRINPAMGRARSDMRRWVDEARAELSTLPDVPARAAFESLCDFVISRTG
jgi:heptaprenyl diphosphate synthase